MLQQFFAVTLISLSTISQQMAQELRELNVYLEKKVPMKVAVSESMSKQEERPITDFYNKVGLKRPRADASSSEKNLENRKLRLRSR